jgi:hypothetical protein
VRWSGRALGGHGEEIAEERGSVLRADAFGMELGVQRVEGLGAFGMELGMQRGGTERVSWASRRKG